MFDNTQAFIFTLSNQIRFSTIEMTEQVSFVTISAGGRLAEKTFEKYASYIHRNISSDNVCLHSEFNVDKYILTDFIDQIKKQCGYKVTSGANTNSTFGILYWFNQNNFPVSHVNKSEFIMDEEEQDCIIVFGNSDGKAGNENKYEFPPPIDNEIYFGTIGLVKVKIFLNENSDTSNRVEIKLEDLTVSQWSKYYEYLFGGFDDCGEGDDDNDDDNASDDGCDIYVELPKTKNGYAKDGFVVDDDASDGTWDDDGDRDSDEEYEDDFYLSDD